MKIIRKKREGIKIEHNRKLFWIIIVLLVVLILLIYFIAQSDKEKGPSQNLSPECSKDGDCVPATCCHPTECVPAEKTPSCKNIMCSMVCSGPLDCNAGYCGCVKGKCEVVPNR